MFILTTATSDPDETCIRVGSASVQPQPVAAVGNLGVYLDADASMRAHVTSTVRACFAILRQINSVRHSLTRPGLITLLRALVISKLDYCSSVLARVVVKSS